jgi:hypothetical protein
MCSFIIYFIISIQNLAIEVNNYKSKGKYKIECGATRTPDKCEGRIRCRGGVSILC